ncbi:MAG TPA: hypothetical protein VM884_02710, partial [Flavisolibacter sp.]|nr:hypothetical protein [Flavisolibacter sp.]
MVLKRKKRNRIAIVAASVLLFFLGFLIILSEFYLGPALQKRLHTLIIDGSDSLYAYKIGSLNASLLGGSVEVNNLTIEVDSNHYNILKSQNELPALVMQLDVRQARIKGINIFSLVFNKKIFIDEIFSGQADVKLFRYPKQKDSTLIEGPKDPLWKSIQSKIKDIQVGSINLNGIKLLYKNAAGLEAAKLQFDRCDAVFQNIRIDSASIADTSRIGYVENFSFRLNGLKYRTPDSAYKMKAEWIAYNSAQRLLTIDSFKLQPTVEKEQRIDSLRKSWYTATFDKVYFNGLRLDRFLRLNRAEADSLVLQSPKLSIYQDKSGLKSYKSKIGDYPHQKLLQADAVIDMKRLIAHNLQVEILEKQEETGKEGRIDLTGLEVNIANIVNDPKLISRNPVATAEASGKIIGSPLQASFRFYLDSAEGRFDV